MANRYARGELISANERIRGRATTLLVSLIGSVSSCGNSTLDNLDPHRRFEEAQPEIAARLTTALESPLPTTARVLVEMSEEELAGRSEVADPQVFATLARLLDCTMPIVDPPPVM